MKRPLACLAVLTLACSAAAQQPADLREAAAKPLSLIQKSQGVWDAKAKCVSCHHQILPELAQAEARSRGVKFDTKFAAEVTAKTFAHLRDLDEIVQGTMFIDVLDDAWRLIAAHAAGIPQSLSTSAIAQFLAGSQRADGSWRTWDARPPSSSSQFTATAVAARGVALYMPETLKDQKQAVLGKAAAWLAKAAPATTEDRVFQLLGLHWTGTDGAIKKSAAALKATQQKDGGWSYLPGENSDAYSTGTALYALHHAGGLVVNAPEYAKGLKFLLDSKHADGSWRVESRLNPTLPVSPDYFNPSFPHAREDKFISITGTAWATVAVMQAIPTAPAPVVALPNFDPADEKVEWVRVSLNGTAADLKAALAKGMNPNSRTKAGTTPLMLAARDPEKVKLLLAEKANVNARADSGVTPLIVAARFYGNVEVVKLLIEAKAEVNAPKGVTVRNDANALFVAVTSGDAEMVRLLLDAKADVEADMKVLGVIVRSPLRSAVVRGDTEVVTVLLKAMAAPDRANAADITPLHIAVVGNRVDVVKALLKGGAKVNAADDEKTTALHYAAYANYPDTAVVEALLKAGADPTLKDMTDRTPLDVAKAFKRTKVAAVLAGKP
jgi:ankyrin repeat protein